MVMCGAVDAPGRARVGEEIPLDALSDGFGEVTDVQCDTGDLRIFEGRNVKCVFEDEPRSWN